MAPAFFEPYTAAACVGIKGNIAVKTILGDKLLYFMIYVYGAAGNAACSAADIYLLCLHVDMRQKFFSVFV